LAPDAVVSYVSRLETNRKALGHNLLVDDRRREESLRTIQSKTTIVAGPVELIQGGEAIIARKPIFFDDVLPSTNINVTQSQRETDTPWLQEVPTNFWGFATVLISTETLYQAVSLDHRHSKYRYAIRGRHGLGNEGEVFWGEESVFANVLETSTITLPNGEWIIAVEMTNGFIWQKSLWILAVGFIFTVLWVYIIIVNFDIIKGQKKADELSSLLSKQQEINRIKSNFLGMMSHELRTPLNSILGLSESLEDDIYGPTSPAQKEILQKMQKQGTNLLGLISDMLDISQIESNEFKYHFKIIDIVPICDKALESIEGVIVSKNIHLHRNIALKECFAYVDARYLFQTLVNLLGNAAKFTQKGGDITFELALLSTDVEPRSFAGDHHSPIYYAVQQPHLGGQRLQLSITDTGLGIETTNFPSIFEFFTQVDNELNRKYEGSGLGLFLVKNIVSAFGGELSVASKLGVGTCFSIILPVPHHGAPA
jgi:signal transduction histidine kinase